MPHQTAIQEDHATSKWRTNFDASSYLKGPSLIDWLKSDESGYTDFFGTLIRFRLNHIAVVINK